MDGKDLPCWLVKCLVVLLLALCYAESSSPVSRSSSRGGGHGRWELLRNNTGVVAMHMALTHHDTVVIFDQTGTGPSSYRLLRRHNGIRCRRNRHDLVDSSCYAHSVEYNILKNTIRPLHLATDTWCSSGSFLSNGTLLQTGGYGEGARRIRYYKPCKNGACDWKQSKMKLSVDRWYASSLRIPEHDRVIVVGGRQAFTYEFVPKFSRSSKPYVIPLLRQTFDRRERGSNLYPILHLSTDGNLFIFANRDSVLFNYKEHKVVKTFPRIPGDGSRSYPSTGSSVILPLDYHNGYKVEVMICGGGAAGAYAAAKRHQFLTGLRTCGRMVITGHNHKWKMENMPGPRLMSDMVILPTGEILIINGAKRGCAGWESAATPALQPYLYNSKKVLGKRFSVLKRTKIARMYHSSALVLPDGRVLVAGGNPNERYVYKGVAHPTELRLQAFVPDYMNLRLDIRRPQNLTVIYRKKSVGGVIRGDKFRVVFRMGHGRVRDLKFMLYAQAFVTHSQSMNQRMVKLRCSNITVDHGGWMTAILVAPPGIHVAPPGYYLLTVVNAWIPSKSLWVRIL